MDAQQAAEKIYMLKQVINSMQEEVDTLQAEHFVNRAVDTYVEGKYKVVVGRNARFDPGLADKAHKDGVITDEIWEQMQETKPSSTKAKDLLAPAVLRTLQKVSDNKVTVTLPKEAD